MSIILLKFKINFEIYIGGLFFVWVFISETVYLYECVLIEIFKHLVKINLLGFRIIAWFTGSMVHQYIHPNVYAPTFLLKKKF